METDNNQEEYNTSYPEKIDISEAIADKIMFTILDLEDENIRLDDEKYSNSEIIEKIKTIIEEEIKGASNDS